MSDIDPTAAARMATGEASGAQSGVSALPEPPDAQRADTGGSAGTLIDGLLETQPAGSVAEYPDMPQAASHALIGAQKFINGIAGERQLDGGKPAVVDFIQAAVSMLSAGDGESVDDSDDAEQSLTPPAAVDVGGDLSE